MPTLTSRKAAEVAGVSQHQLARWTRGGHIVPTGRMIGDKKNNLFDLTEVHVICTMARLLRAGFHDLAEVEALARKHVDGVAVFEAMGYDEDSSTTEHTIGDGIVITITRDTPWLSSTRTSIR